MKKTTLALKDMLYCAISAALITVCAWLSLPVLQIAFTLQTFAVFFVLTLLGGRRGTVSVLLYLLLGLSGLPVFSGFRGGAGVLLGATGGFLWGFLASALVYWAAAAAFGKGRWVPFAAAALAMAACYGCGCVWYLCAYAEGSLTAVISVCVAPYLLPDGVKICLALYLSRRLKPVLKI